MNLRRFKIGELLSFIENKSWIVFIFLSILVFTLFRSLFGSYFEADEWVHFTYYFPLTGRPDGFLTALMSTFVNTGFLTGDGQHINPIATAIFFLNTKFFGLYYAPYAFMSLLFHTINSFLVFLFIKTLLHQKQNLIKNVFAILGAVFFALAPTPIHAVTGAAPFYSYNVLSVTFFLLCVISFKVAFIKRQKKLIYASILFLFASLFSKETTAFLFILLPFMVIIEKKPMPDGRRVFPLKFLSKFFFASLIVYVVFRFVIPNFNTLPGKIIDKFVEGYIPESYTQPTKTVDTGTIVSRDLSIHKNIYGEVVFRAITYPLKMTSELYFPRETVLSFMRVLTPIIYPLPSNVSGDEETIKSQNYQFFMNGPGNDLIIYILSVVILVIVINRAKQLLSDKRVDEYKTVITGLAIVVLSSLPLAFIVLSFPRWGYDTYFDSRHYYIPTVGAAILFPFLLFEIVNFVSSLLSKARIPIPFPAIAVLLFLIWLRSNMNVFNNNMHIIVDLIGYPRRQIIYQMKQYLPALPQKAVFYVETDGLGAYGPVLPFQTSVAQAFTIIYYDKNPLPDEFFNEFIFEKTGEGYKEIKGRGFGYFTSKKALSEALLSNQFATENIYGFYYDSQKIKLRNITKPLRLEMKNFLEEKDEQ